MMPAEICTRLNDALSGEYNENGMFVTMFLGLLNLQLRAIRYENACQVIETMEAEVEKHRDGAEPNDDLTIMCIKL
jgi:serine phosphatase RsbU (regulator of sigma subunit)